MYVIYLRLACSSPSLFTVHALTVFTCACSCKLYLKLVVFLSCALTIDLLDYVLVYTIYALTKLTTHLLLYSQEFCRRNLIPHIVVLSDKELFFERKQVRLRTLEPTGKSSEKTLAVSELPEFLLQQRHGPEHGDSVEAQSSARIGGGPSNLDPFPSNARPPVNVTVLATSKLSGHFKRKIHDAVSLSLSPFPPSLLFFLVRKVSKCLCFCRH